MPQSDHNVADFSKNIPKTPDFSELPLSSNCSLAAFNIPQDPGSGILNLDSLGYDNREYFVRPLDVLFRHIFHRWSNVDRIFDT